MQLLVHRRGQDNGPELGGRGNGEGEIGGSSTDADGGVLRVIPITAATADIISGLAPVLVRCFRIRGSL